MVPLASAIEVALEQRSPATRAPQTPALHVLAHATPQAPQFALSAVEYVSHPSAPDALQSRHGTEHPSVGAEHVPAEHVASAPSELHTLPHAPQEREFARMSVSQPSSGSLLQSAKPALHVVEQPPPVQSGVPWFDEHATPHAPQFVRLEKMSVHAPPQLVC
jgi:hypothetical protein